MVLILDGLERVGKYPSLHISYTSEKVMLSALIS